MERESPVLNNHPSRSSECTGKNKKKRREEKHQNLVGRMMSSAEGGAGFLHRITKPAAWSGGLQVLEELEEDAKPMKRCEDKREEWAKHWRCDSELQRRGGQDNGGVERSAWETLLEMERFDYRAGEVDQGAITLVLDVARAFERVPGKILLVLCGQLQAPAAGLV